MNEIRLVASAMGIIYLLNVHGCFDGGLDDFRFRVLIEDTSMEMISLVFVLRALIF